MIITDSATLSTFCAALRGAPYIAVDTEFLRERTYYAQLCLVQVAHGAHAAVIDPLSRGLDLAPLRELLLDPSIVKVFHAASQDLEIFFQKIGQVPSPVFDTQIAAAACDKGDQPGYATLVHNLLGIDLDKASQATDWSVRPLTERQITYALGDVTHLCRIYEMLVQELAARGRAGWVHEDMAALLDERRYKVEPREAYRRLRMRGPTRKTLCVLRELAAWREEAAMERDLPRPWVVHDDALVEIAQHLPEDIEQLARVRTLKPPVARGADGKALLAVVRRALELPEDTWPVMPDRRPPLEGHESLVALLQALLRLRCEAHGVATRMVASREDLDQLATVDVPDIPCLSGWRRELFGADALELRAGRLALTGRDGSVVATRIDAG
ncbi:MAG: ribonuclease D [Pseudomonadota bacterium]|nr:ribonuclease D [Pseudomonadota bacterium]